MSKLPSGYITQILAMIEKLAEAMENNDMTLIHEVKMECQLTKRIVIENMKQRLVELVKPKTISDELQSHNSDEVQK